MAGEVSTTSSGMRAAGQHFVSTYNEIDGLMKRLKDQLLTLRSQWDGDAAAIFQSTMDEWGVSFDRILVHLDAMADLLLGGAGHVESSEQFATQHGKFFS